MNCRHSAHSAGPPHFDPKSTPKIASVFHPISESLFSRFCLPKASQNGAKNLKKSSQNIFLFWIRFFIDVHAFLIHVNEFLIDTGSKYTIVPKYFRHKDITSKIHPQHNKYKNIIVDAERHRRTPKTLAISMQND